MRRTGTLIVAVALVAALASGCQHTVQVQTGTRVVDEQGRVVSEEDQDGLCATRRGGQVPRCHRDPGVETHRALRRGAARDRRRRPGDGRGEARRAPEHLEAVQKGPGAARLDQGRQEGRGRHRRERRRRRFRRRIIGWLHQAAALDGAHGGAHRTGALDARRAQRFLGGQGAARSALGVSAVHGRERLLLRSSSSTPSSSARRPRREAARDFRSSSATPRAPTA